MQPKKILILEEDEYFRESLTENLKNQYSIFQANNTEAAREIMQIQNFDLLLTEVENASDEKISFLEWSRKVNTPMVLMSTLANTFQNERVKALGAKSLMLRPFTTEALLDVINKCIASCDEPQIFKKSSSDFCRVAINELILRPHLEFDLYIRLSEKNFIKLAQKNDAFPIKQINQYKLKGITHLHILREDFKYLVSFTLDLAKIIKNNDEIPRAKKLAFMEYVGKIILEQVFTQGLDPENITEVGTFVELTVGTVIESKEIFDLMEVLNKSSNDIYNHSITVAMYTVLIAKQLKFESSLTSFKLCQAALFHDIGKKEIDASLLKKPRHLLTHDEKKVIESHVVRGQEILMSLKSMHSDIIRIVSEHHEDMQGLGYPFAKKRKDQHPLSRILQCADIFLNTLKTMKQEKNKIEVLEVIEYIEKVYSTRVDADCLNALRELFKLPQLQTPRTN